MLAAIYIDDLAGDTPGGPGMGRVLDVRLHFHYLHEALKTGALEVIDVGVDPDITPISIAYQNDVRPSAKLTALIEHLKRAFGNPPYWDEGLPQVR